MEVYRVEPVGEAWRVMRAEQAVLVRGNERAARKAAEVLNAWALVEMALHLGEEAERPGRGRLFHA